MVPSVEIRVRILPEVLADLAGPSRDWVRKRLFLNREKIHPARRDPAGDSKRKGCHEGSDGRDRPPDFVRNGVSTKRRTQP